MKRQITLILLIIGFTACNSPKQISRIPDRTENRTSYSMDDYNELINSWDFFIGNKKVTVVIIDYYSAFTRCDRAIENGLAIVEYENDTIRIIDMCPGERDYIIGDTLIFESEDKLFENNNLGIIYIDGNPNPILFKHRKVLKTTFGQLRKKN